MLHVVVAVEKIVEYCWAWRILHLGIDPQPIPLVHLWWELSNDDSRNAAVLQNICRNFFIIEQRDSISRYDSHLIITVLSVIMYTWRKPDPLTMEMQALASLECKSQSVWWGVRESLCKFREVNKYLSWQQRKKKKWRRQWIDYALVSPICNL